MAVAAAHEVNHQPWGGPIPARVKRHDPLNELRQHAGFMVGQHPKTRTELHHRRVRPRRRRRRLSPGTLRQPLSPGTLRQPLSPGTLRQPLSPGTLRQPLSPGTLRQPLSPGTLRQRLSPGTLRQRLSPGAFCRSGRPGSAVWAVVGSAWPPVSVGAGGVGSFGPVACSSAEAALTLSNMSTA